MKINVNEYGNIVLEEVFNGITMTQPDGNSIGICMRDNTFEINVIPKDLNVRTRWNRVNMKTSKIEEME